MSDFHNMDEINAKYNFNPKSHITHPPASEEDFRDTFAKVRILAQSNGVDMTDPAIGDMIAELSERLADAVTEGKWLMDILSMPEYAGTEIKPLTGIHPDQTMAAKMGIENLAFRHGIDLSAPAMQQFLSELIPLSARITANTHRLNWYMHPKIRENKENYMDLLRMAELAGVPMDTPRMKKLTEAANIMGEISLYEALKLVHDEATGMLAAVSNENDNRVAASDTYKHRALLKANGFKWDGSKWVIPTDQMDVAKTVLTQANKTEYLIDKLEDIEKMVASSEPSDKSSLLSNKITQYIKQLASETDEKAASSEIRRYLDFFANFHQYSFTNKMLVYIQRPDATKVASFKKWKEKNRQVVKGAKGITIFVPIFDKDKNPLQNPEAEGKSRPMRFTTGNVFDISDTKPINDEGEVPETPQWWGDNTPDETCDELFDLVQIAATSEGIDVTRHASTKGEKGYSAGGHINISSDVEGAGKVATMVHEYAHELMHRPESKFFVGQEDISSKEVKELQAESVSYIVMKHYGIQVEHQTTYLALWKANSESIERNMATLSKVSEYIIRKLDGAAGAEMAAEKEDGFTESIVTEMVSRLR